MDEAGAQLSAADAAQLTADDAATAGGPADGQLPRTRIASEVEGRRSQLPG